ncbi:RE2, partial [Symbiodinium necroappetens]
TLVTTRLFSDFKKLLDKPRHAELWLSKKMMDKGREVSWSSLTLDKKKEFDGAMAKEISNVIRNCAVRALAAKEKEKLDIRRIMKMRWVLTFKSDGRAKARLVVLGYQSPTLVESQASSPTLSKLGKMLILSIVANNSWMLESADVSSAFLQSLQDMEKEDLFVYAPAELAAAYGADGTEDSTVLKLTRAFYGLCSAPKSWYDTVTATLRNSGWRPLEFDKCFFILVNKASELCGVAGFHVDDFLIGRRKGDETFERAKAEHLSSFEWGRWEQKNFEFPGANLTQKEDGTIFLDQRSYTETWVEEIVIRSSRASQTKSKTTPKEISDIRGALGTVSWRAHQVSPQYLAEVGLLLSEIPTATVDTLLRVNKLVRQVKRNSEQTLIFHPFGRDWKVLGSNGSEVQTITIVEDLTYLVRCAWLEAHGHPPIRGEQARMVKDNTVGAISAGTHLRWVAGTEQLADGLTKGRKRTKREQEKRIRE